jgi:hypothetical protein
MTAEQLARQLLPSFSVIHYFIRHHPIETRRATANCAAAKIKKGDDIDLTVMDFSLLWLIEALVARTRKKCRQTEARDITAWRRCVVEDPETATTRFDNHNVCRLVCTGLVNNQGRDPSNRTRSLLRLTKKGKALLKDLEDDRVMMLTRLLSLAPADEINFDATIDIFSKIADGAWAIICTEARQMGQKA